MSDWFVVMTDESSASLSVSPPGRDPWQAVIPWDSVTRVCLEATGFPLAYGLYVFTSLRPESWVVPAEADGGQGPLSELIRRGLLDASLAIIAAQAHEGMFCWPPFGVPGTGHRRLAALRNRHARPIRHRRSQIAISRPGESAGRARPLRSAVPAHHLLEPAEVRTGAAMLADQYVGVTIRVAA